LLRSSLIARKIKSSICPTVLCFVMLRISLAYIYLGIKYCRKVKGESEAIRAPFKPVGEVVDGYFSLQADDPKEYDSKTGLWQFGRGEQ